MSELIKPSDHIAGTHGVLMSAEKAIALNNFFNKLPELNQFLDSLLAADADKGIITYEDEDDNY